MLALSQMTPEQKLGRVLCFRRTHMAEDLEFTLEMIKKEAVGCVQIALNDKTRELAAKLKAAADYPLLIINDTERGYPPSGLPMLSTVTLSACGNPEYIRLFGAAIAKGAREDGLTGTWSPVVDIHHNRHDILSTARHAGDSVEAVTDFARELLVAFNSYNFGGSAKHYPGGNHVGSDTHMMEAINDISEEELVRVDLAPYRTLWREGLLHSIMVDHSVFPQIDPDYPASMSKKVVDLIRREGFDGVLYTDSFAMMGILQKYGEKNAMVCALNAGNDIILPNYRTPSREIYEMMLSAYREGLIPDARLDEAVRRVMAEEQRCAKIPENPIEVPDNMAAILDNVVRDSITADCAEGVTPALDNPEGRRLFILLTPQDYVEGPLGEISAGQWYYPELVKEAIRENFPNAEVVTLPEYPNAHQNDVTLTAATKHDEIVFVSFCQSGCYLGSDGLTRRVETVFSALAVSGKVSAHVHFGNPTALCDLPKVARRIYGYNATPAQRYAIEVLAGKIPAKGKKPFPRFM
ncbi:MAG: hypothetical protein J6T24_05990 [Clostridia bacterium]|nr:hypothetical protein [Clostridia bacterium]